MKMTTTTSCLSLTTVESTASESLISATTLASKSNSKPSESISTPEFHSLTFDVYAEDFTRYAEESHLVWNPNKFSDLSRFPAINETTWMNFWEQDYEDKLIKKIKQDVEKWESEFGEFAIDIKDGKHDEL